MALDSTQLKAVNRNRRNGTQAKRPETLKRLEAHIEQYWPDLAAADADAPESQQTTAEHLREKIQALRERKARDAGLRRQREISGQRQVSWTDPDSRARPKSPNVDGGDKAQVVVDATHHLSMVPEGTKAVTDVDQLRAIALQAKAALEGARVTGVAERGSSPGEELKAGEEAGLEPYVAPPGTSANRPLGLYGKEPLPDEPEHDRYRGPAGQALTCRLATGALGRSIRS